MSQKISPHRRRSLAVLSQGSSARSGPLSRRRRAYSIAPGEKLSPAARARRLLVPRKSILKTSVNPASQDATTQPDNTETSAFITPDDTGVTQSMEFTQIAPAASRKSLARRVSFAEKAYVKLFKVPEQNSSSPAQDSPSQSQDQPNYENAVRRRSAVGRRSSLAYSEYGERSMDMDMDDTAPLPEEFLKQFRTQTNESALEDDDFTDDDDDEEDMEVTEAIAMNINRKRSLSLGGPSFPGRGRSSIAPLTSSQSYSENQPPPRLQILHLPRHVEGQSYEHDQAEEDQDLTTSSSRSFVTEGSSGEDTQPMEFTIPISRSLREPKPPTEAWLKLRAMTHAGAEPYEPPPPESDDDDGFDQPSYSHAAEDRGEEPMELTDAVTRLLKARSSLGLPPLSADTTDGGSFVQEEQFQDDTFTSTEDSFADDDVVGAGDHTVNLTSLRMSLGTLDSTMDETDVYDEAAVNVPINAPTSDQPSFVPTTAAATSTTSTLQLLPLPLLYPTVSSNQALPSVFSAPQPVKGSVFSAPSAATNIFVPVSAPRSPGKPPAPATVPKPFTFGIPRPPSPAKATVVPPPAKSPAPSSSTASRLPVHKGTAAFALPSTPKSPLKRPAPSDADDARNKEDRPSSAKRPAVGKLSPSKKAAFERPAQSAAAPALANRRSSMARRPSGYFAQRKSLGAGVLPPNLSATGEGRGGTPKKTAGPGLGLGRARASMGATPSGAGLGLNPPGIGIQGTTAEGGENGPLYPDVARIAVEGPPTPSRVRSPAPASVQAKVCERESLRQAIAAPSATRGSPAPASPRIASPSVRDGKPGVVNSSATAAQRLKSPVASRPFLSGSPVSQSVAIQPPAVIEEEYEEGDMELDTTTERATIPTTPTRSIVSQQWREGLQGEDAYDDDEGPPISIEQFFAMTGVRFMDELTTPKPRRSTVLPGQLRPRPRRRSSVEPGSATAGEEEPIPLSEFAIAMAVDVPRLELYSAVAKDLTGWIEESKKICLQAEEEAQKVTPSLFREFAASDESEQAILLHQLKLIKANNMGTAKSQWYDWKLQWVEQLYSTAAHGFSNLESDARTLALINQDAQNILPALREEYAQVLALLEQEQADIDEIEHSDHDYLNELKTTIAEQSTELETFRTDVSGEKAKLERLKEKLAEIEAQKEEASAAIAQDQHIIHIQKESTSSEIFKLKDELEALQELHLWRATKITADLVQFVYDSRYQVSIPCTYYCPIPSQVTACKLKAARMKERDPFPQFTNLVLRTAQELIVAHEHITIKKIVECLGDFWSSCAQLRSQLVFLAIKYPLTVETIETEMSLALKATATVLFPHSKGKAFISFLLDKETYSRWPMSIDSLKSEVQIAYGNIQRDAIHNAVLGRLAQANAADNHGCLLDACIEATEQYD
ncbi:Kinetochore protein spc7 [Grifola frondosa]|uniref:Kinetochore protein spc7 n=1 Tax=Grifola frondosa TaxID=5627 RepID=A0A1C7MQX6_GRIFR|nr:Kinetochore protein spc7 [Grifola frondosa]